MNKYIKIFLSLLIAGSLSSCDLERLPENSVEPQIETLSDAQHWDNGIMAFFRGRQYGIFNFPQDVQADYVNATVGFGNRSGMIHNWLFTATDFTIRDVWFAYYRALANVNLGIASYPAVRANLTTDAQRAQLDRFLGNAHFARAFYYNELALRWSNSFDPATAATELSVPIVTEFDAPRFDYLPARATLQQVYNFILEDIARARTLLADVPGVPGATRFNRDVVTALEARVRLYMQDWAGAFAAANSLIESGTYPLETTVEGMQELWIHDNSDEVIMQAHISAPLELPAAGGAVANNIFTNNWIYVGYQPHLSPFPRFVPDFLPSQWVVDMFCADDIRRPVYFTRGTVVTAGITANNVYVMTKFRGNPAITGAQVGTPGTQAAAHNAQAPKVFRIAEMYLIAAEAAFRMGNEADALTALNTLRQARGLGAVNALSAAVGSAPPQEIQDERFRELAFEGFRLWDLRRWGLGVERREPQPAAAGILNTGAAFTTLSRPAGDHRFVWGIPDNDIRVNPNLRPQNPGW